MDIRTMVVDLGFSYAKFLYGNEKGRIPSAFRSRAGGYTYGSDALVKSGSSYLKTPDELIRHYPEFVSICMQNAGVPEDQPIRLAVGLPYAYWEMESRSGGAVEALANKLKNKNIVEVMVLPQGFGGMNDYIVSDEAVMTGNVLAIDIGFNAVFFSLFSLDEDMIIYGKTYYRRGIHQMVVDHLLPRIAHLGSAWAYTPLELSIWTERGEIQYGFDKFDIKNEIQEAANEYLAALIDDIYAEVQVETVSFAAISTVLFFGGGAILLKNTLPINILLSSFKILEEPEYANARGFANYAASIER